MKILGLDLSLSSSGWVVLRDEYLEASGTSATEKDIVKARDVERLILFDRWLGKLLDQHEPDHVAIEGYSYGTPAGSTHAFAMGELGGVIKIAVALEKIPLTIVAPSQWRKALCGKGNIRKNEVPVELFARYGVRFASQDTLEAWAVAETCRRQLLGLVEKPAPKSRKRKLAQQGAFEVLA